MSIVNGLGIDLISASIGSEQTLSPMVWAVPVAMRDLQNLLCHKPQEEPVFPWYLG